MDGAGLFFIRRAKASDAEACYRICVATGDAGGDATALYRADSKALGRLYTQPYLEFSLATCFVLTAPQGVVGYTLGTPDTRAFNAWMRDTYLPRLQAEFPRPDAARRSEWTPEQAMYEEYHAWDPHFPAAYEALFPGHLHIDLLPSARGKGQGRAMVEAILDALARAGARGVHLCMARSNTGAYGFYKRVGFQELGRAGQDLWMGTRRATEPISSRLRHALPPRGFVTGVVEGFYGRPWREAQREELLARMGAWGLGAYMYAPKDDAKHRALWRTPYSAEELVALRRLVARSHAAGVRFIYALAPGLDVAYDSDTDVDALLAKVDQVLDLGVTSLALLFDDIPEALAPADAAAFGHHASAQCALANAVAMHAMTRAATRGGLRWPPPGTGTAAGAGAAAGGEGKEGVGSGVAPLSFLLCPTEYCSELSPGGRPVASEYLQRMGRELLPEFTALWTGPDVISQAVLPMHLLRVSRTLQRRLLLWDNLHANDYDAGRRVFLGPYGPGRDADDLPSICAGVLANPNCEYEANFVPLRTLALFGQHARAAAPWDALTEAYLAAIEASSEADHVHAETLTAAQRVAGGFDVRSAFRQAVQEWREAAWTPLEGAQADRVALDDLLLVADAFYLPYQLGPRAQLLLATVRHALIATDFDGAVTGLPPLELLAQLRGDADTASPQRSHRWRFTSHFPDAPDLNEPATAGALLASPRDEEEEEEGKAGGAQDAAADVFSSPVRRRPASRLGSWLQRLGVGWTAGSGRSADVLGEVPAAPLMHAPPRAASATDVRLAMAPAGAAGDTANTHDISPLTSPTLKAAKRRSPAGSAVEDALALCDAVCRVFTASTQLARRDVSYDLYRFLWDLKERAEVAKEYLAWAAARQGEALAQPAQAAGGSPLGGSFALAGAGGGLTVTSQGSFFGGGGAGSPGSAAGAAFHSKWHKAGPIGGGVLAAFDALIMWRPDAGAFKAARLAVREAV